MPINPSHFWRFPTGPIMVASCPRTIDFAHWWGLGTKDQNACDMIVHVLEVLNLERGLIFEYRWVRKAKRRVSYWCSASVSSTLVMTDDRETAV